MVDYREILRLKSLNYSQTDIAASVHSSRNTIQEVLSIASALQIQWPLDDDVTNRVLESILYPDRHKKDEERFEYSRAVTPQIRQAGNHLSGLAETAYASLLAQCFV